MGPDNGSGEASLGWCVCGGVDREALIAFEQRSNILKGELIDN